MCNKTSRVHTYSMVAHCILYIYIYCTLEGSKINEVLFIMVRLLIVTSQNGIIFQWNLIKLHRRNTIVPIRFQTR